MNENGGEKGWRQAGAAKKEIRKGKGAKEHRRHDDDTHDTDTHGTTGRHRGQRAVQHRRSATETVNDDDGSQRQTAAGTSRAETARVNVAKNGGHYCWLTTYCAAVGMKEGWAIRQWGEE